MTDQCERLMAALFCHPEREHIDVKFLTLGANLATTREDFCRAAADTIEQMHAKVGADEEFFEARQSVLVAELVAGR